MVFEKGEHTTVNEPCEVVITAPDPEWLLSVMRQLVKEKLRASVHNLTPVRSIYHWQGELVKRTEGRTELHTRRSLAPEIVSRVKTEHPHEVPGIWAIPITDGNPDYWRSSPMKQGSLFKSEFKEVQPHGGSVGRHICAEWPPVVGVEVG
jgi:periplasmic divalent cation tolerance protein